MGKKKAKAEEKLEVSESKTSVKTYQRGIDAKKQKMNEYAGKFANAVKSVQKDAKSLQKEFESHKRELQNAALEMREEGVKKMSGKVDKFKAEIRGQIKENREAVNNITESTMHLLSEIDRERKDFQAYIHGAFQQYINAFWGR